MERTQVGIIGAGPAGLLLSHLLALAGVESVVVELRSREHCEQRQRAGLLEHGTVATLRAAGLAGRLDAQSVEHGGIYLQYAGSGTISTSATSSTGRSRSTPRRRS
ncbi:FAD-dependent monooxygenase [Luedemannella flava]